MAAIPYGADPRGAPLSAVLIHGRDRSAAEMIGQAERIGLPEVAWRALQAPGGSWYPGSFLDPLAVNRPRLEQALTRVEREVQALEAVGVARRRIALVGFSQGACVACEYVRRHAERWGALIAWTGGLFGPDGSTWAAAGRLGGTPVLLSNSDIDPFVPWPRTEATAAAFRRLGAEVTPKLYPGREHIVGDDEIAEARTILRRALRAQPSPVLQEQS
ncbi:MAG TPA: dienelactone hydrolase family protein [Caulobacteraceae bacterium]